jgi:RNA polymerase sigma factor (sigma-70 family)
MEEALRKPGMMAEQDRRISEAIEREQSRLRNFVRRRVADREDAEDILQEVFYELVEAYRMVKPVEQVTAWLCRVARNRTCFAANNGRRCETNPQRLTRTEKGWDWKIYFPPRTPGRTQRMHAWCCWKN